MGRARIDVGPVVGAAGALLLAASLFVSWYQPDIPAFDAFELIDLVLLALGVLSLLGLLQSLGVSVPGGEPLSGAVAPMAGAALVLVASQALNHPPAAAGHEAASGQWLALAGAGLMAAGAALTTTRFSIAVNLDVPQRGARQHTRPGAAREAAPQPQSAAATLAAEHEVMGELYPEGERHGPIGADDPELSRVEAEERP
jgi:hypothetical protein